MAKEEDPKKWAPLYPGWALSPPGWKERNQREGWETRYTTVGARPRGARMHPLETDASSPGYRRLWFGLSAVLVGVRPNQHELTNDVAYWVTLARKLMQRGTLPPTGTHEERDPPTPELLAWLFASNEKHPVDPAIDLHPVFEKPFFDALIKKQPSWASFVFPQAPFEALTVEGGSRTTRWVDFLFAPPTIKTEVVELDGSQHAFAQDVDAERDGALKEAGIEVRRVEGGKWDEFLHSLSKTSNPCSLSQEDVPEGETWREALLAARSVFGIIEAVANGFLEVGSDWQVELPSGVGNEEVFKELLALVVSVDELWTTKVVPKNIFILGPDEFRWQNRFGGVESTKTSSKLIGHQTGPCCPTMKPGLTWLFAECRFRCMQAGTRLFHPNGEISAGQRVARPLKWMASLGWWLIMPLALNNFALANPKRLGEFLRVKIVVSCFPLAMVRP